MVTGTNDRFLLMGAAIPLTYAKAESYMHWLDVISLRKEDTDAFIFRQDSVGKSARTNKETPARFVMGADFPEIDIGRPTITGDITEARGFAIRLPRKLVRGPTGKADIMEAYDSAGFYMAELMNSIIGTAMTTSGNYGTTTLFNPGAVWSDAAAAPIKDLHNLARDMRRDGYPYRMTDVYMGENGFFELLDYVRDVDVADGKQRHFYGLPDTTQEIIRIPMVGNIHMVSSGVDDGAIMGLDANNKGVEYHFYNDPAFSIPRISYETVVNGTPTKKSVPNLGFHYNTYVEPDTHDQVMQFWLEGKTVVTHPYSLIYTSSGI